VTDKYEIRLDPRAIRNLQHLDPVIRQQIAAKIDALATDPEPPGCKALKGQKPLVLRVRVRAWRILYRVVHDEGVVLVLDVDHRADVYR
jgi:mRNA interferase RelE/StbE